MLKRIVIWGAGKMLPLVCVAINRNIAKVVGIVDTKYKSMSVYGTGKGKFIIGNPVLLSKEEYDYVVVSVKNDAGIVEQCGKMGIPKEKIIRFWCDEVAPDFLVDAKENMKEIGDMLEAFGSKSTEQHAFFNINGFDLDLGEGHSLAFNMKEYPMYDRFVPYLGVLADCLLPEGKNIIVDIGANVGDTVAALITNTACKVICVEPTTCFFDLLKENVASFGENYSRNIDLVKAYVTKNGTERLRSIVSNGTAVRIDLDETQECEEAIALTIPQLVELKGCSVEDIALIKVDTDGYDADCILSLRDSIKQLKALLYWENQIDSLEQRDNYILMTRYLTNHGYDTFFVFDNYGNYQCKVDAEGMIEIDNYLGRIAGGVSRRSYYYVDVLACRNEQVAICKKTIGEYLARFNND